MTRLPKKKVKTTTTKNNNIVKIKKELSIKQEEFSDNDNNDDINMNDINTGSNGSEYDEIKVKIEDDQEEEEKIKLLFDDADRDDEEQEQQLNIQEGKAKRDAERKNRNDRRRAETTNQQQTKILGNKFITILVTSMDCRQFKNMNKGSLRKKYYEAISNITHPIREYLFTPPAFYFFNLQITKELENIELEDNRKEKENKEKIENNKSQIDNEKVNKRFNHMLYTNCRGGNQIVNRLINEKVGPFESLFKQAYYSPLPHKQTIKHYTDGSNDLLTVLSTFNTLSITSPKYLQSFVYQLKTNIDYNNLEMVEKVYKEMYTYLKMSLLPTYNVQFGMEYVDFATCLLKASMVLSSHLGDKHTTVERDYTYILLLVGQIDQLGKLVRLLSSFDFNSSPYILNNNNNNNNNVISRLLAKFYDLTQLRPATKIHSYLLSRVVIGRAITLLTNLKDPIVSKFKIAQVSNHPPKELINYVTTYPHLVASSNGIHNTDIAKAITQLSIEQSLQIMTHVTSDKKRKQQDIQVKKEEDDSDIDQEEELEQEEDGDDDDFVVDKSGAGFKKVDIQVEPTPSTQSSSMLASLLDGFSDDEDEENQNDDGDKEEEDN